MHFSVVHGLPTCKFLPEAQAAFIMRPPQLPLAGRSLRRHPRYVATVTLDSALAREGRLQPSATTRDGAARAVAERRKRAACPELLRRGPQTLCMRACETGGWNDESLRLALVAQLVAGAC